jgi:serine/threonine-protein kinase
MPLASGTRLGPYEVAAPLGAGGMGEVYRARDTRLGRDVAVKHFRERFDREAKAISSLNHPHICTLHDVGSADGVEFLVLEFLEGESLEQRLERAGSPLPLHEALGIAIQVTDALGAAHRAGIVHRDLKPGNVMLARRSGSAPTVKLLDFGLARSAPAAATISATVTPTMAPTTPATLTAQGAVLGTFQYMAPEQIEGGEADARTDLFAFGLVLYEMLTGRRAFAGKSHAGLMSAILKDTPASPSSLQPGLPPVLDRLVATCLAKDPDDRWQDARDLRRELQWIAAGGHSPSTETARIARSTGRALVPWSAAGLTTLVAALAWFWPSATPTNPPTRLVIPIPPTHDLYTGGGGVPAISDDGRTVVYIGTPRSGGRRLYRRSLDSLEAIEIPGSSTAGANPSLSPDGRLVAFSSPRPSGGVRNQQFTIGMDGGTPEIVFELEANFGSTWLDENTLVFTVIEDGTRRLFRTTLRSGTPTPLTTPAAGTWHMYPDARASVVAYTVWSGTLESAKVGVKSLESGEERVLLDGTSPRITASGHLVFARDSALWAVGFDASRLAVLGEPRRVVDNVQVNSGGLALYDISATGTLVYVPGAVGTQRSLVWVDRQGNEQSVPVDAKEYSSARVSPDGSRIVLDTARADDDLWLWDGQRNVLRRFTTEPGADLSPEWTRDGRQVVFASSRRGQSNLFVQVVDSAAAAKPLLPSPDAQQPISFAPDGRLLFWTNPAGGGPRQLQAMAIGSTTPTGAQPLPSLGGGPAISPDGRWIAYESLETGQSEVYVRPYPNVDGSKWQVSTGGATQAAWSLRGDELFFVQDQALMRVAVEPGPTFQFGPATSVVPGRYFLSAGGRRRYDLSPDGERFLLLKESGSQHLVVVQNWFEELR